MTISISKELIAKAMKIHYKANFLVDNLFKGEYASAFKGSGMDFDAVRTYQPGDEIRSIDWNVTARTGRPHVKSFKEERELTIMIMIDVSGSFMFGSSGVKKRDTAAELAAILAFAAIKNNDRVGAIIFSDRIEKFLPPRKGRSYVFEVVRDIMEVKPVGKSTDLAGAVEFFMKTNKKRAACFLVSDFMVDGLGTPLKIASRKHDLVALRVVDPLEKVMPPVGIVEMKDLETGEARMVDTFSRQAREVYRQRAEKHTETVSGFFKKIRTDYLEIDTGSDIIKPLESMFNTRTKRNRTLRR